MMIVSLLLQKFTWLPHQLFSIELKFKNTRIGSPLVALCSCYI